MNDLDKVKGWLGLGLVVWPIVRLVLGAFGVSLPDLGSFPDIAAPMSQVGGAALLAKSKPLGKR